MKVLVTGASGFIGKYLVEELWKDKRVEKLYCVSRSFTDYPYRELGNSDRLYREFYCDIKKYHLVKDLMEITKPDVIFHLGAISKVKPDKDNPTDIIETNINGTFNLLDTCPEKCRFVFASSVLVSGNKESKEFHPITSSPSSVYGATKAACENLIHVFDEQNKIEGKILRLVANVGGKSTHGVLHDLYNKLKSDSKYLEVIGVSPGSIKPFRHVSDTVLKFIDVGIYDYYTGWEITNVSPKDNISVLEICNELMNLTGIHKPIKWLGNEANWIGDNPVIKAEPLFQRFPYKFHTSKQAIRQAIQEKIINE